MWNSCAGSNLALPLRCCRGTTVSKAGEIFYLKGLGSAPGPSPKCANVLAFRFTEDAPQLEAALSQYGSAAKDVSLWPHAKFVRGFDPGGTSAVLPRCHCLKAMDILSLRGLGSAPGPSPKCTHVLVSRFPENAPQL